MLCTVYSTLITVKSRLDDPINVSFNFSEFFRKTISKHVRRSFFFLFFLFIIFCEQKVGGGRKKVGGGPPRRLHTRGNAVRVSIATLAPCALQLGVRGVCDERGHPVYGGVRVRSVARRPRVLRRQLPALQVPVRRPADGGRPRRAGTSPPRPPSASADGARCLTRTTPVFIWPQCHCA